MWSSFFNFPDMIDAKKKTKKKQRKIRFQLKKKKTRSKKRRTSTKSSSSSSGSSSILHILATLSAHVSRKVFVSTQENKLWFCREVCVAKQGIRVQLSDDDGY